MQEEWLQMGWLVGAMVERKDVRSYNLHLLL
jgi:hypothetical protein